MFELNLIKYRTAARARRRMVALVVVLLLVLSGAACGGLAYMFAQQKTKNDEIARRRDFERNAYKRIETKLKDWATIRTQRNEKITHYNNARKLIESRRVFTRMLVDLAKFPKPAESDPEILKEMRDAGDLKETDDYYWFKNIRVSRETGGSDPKIKLPLTAIGEFAAVVYGTAVKKRKAKNDLTKKWDMHSEYLLFAIGNLQARPSLEIPIPQLPEGPAEGDNPLVGTDQERFWVLEFGLSTYRSGKLRYGVGPNQ